jgi:hypothetical protein
MCLSRYTVTLTAVFTPIRYFADRCIQQHNMPSRRPVSLRGDTVNCRGTPVAARYVFKLFCRCADRVQLHHYSLRRYADRSAYADRCQLPPHLVSPSCDDLDELDVKPTTPLNKMHATLFCL